MNHKENGLGLHVALAIFGFFLLGGLSLGAGNSMVTSLTRGAIGLLSLFFFGFALKFALQTFVGGPNLTDDVRGKHIDLLLPEQSPMILGSTDQAGDADFVPLSKSLLQKEISDEEARKMAEALRHLDD